MIYNEELFGNNILNFEYDIFDISNDEKLKKETLIGLKNVTSAIFLLDQKMDALEFLERIRVIALYFNSLNDTEIKAIKKWVKNTVVDPLAESAIKILEADREEVELMVARNAFILDEMKEKSKAEGREEGIKEGIKEGRAELLIKQLGIKFKDLPKNYKEKIKELSEDKIEEIGLNIFNLNDIKDLNQYL